MAVGSAESERRRWARGARLASKIDEAGRGLDEWAASRSPVPELRERVQALAESRWGEPVIALHLGDVRPVFEIPGRRKDGTVKGKRLIRRFFWNILRGVVNAVANIVMLFAGGVGDVFGRTGRVTGPADAQALGLVDTARAAKDAWLVYTTNPTGDSRQSYTPSRLAVVDAGPDEPAFVGQAGQAEPPLVSPRRRRLTWPDHSVFEHHASESGVVGG
ncbi:hypothetical protein [Actinophytocola sp.]|uniref:hypothetical protein n=1 Tax=Actinophytocola sp. TaxID=1872138 RepID=UPI002D31FEE2|nr:hypothetical protein [Actinophytocola sp.]HYQ64258.1 hypothetical protein [Actinophytocola sp.]